MHHNFATVRHAQGAYKFGKIKFPDFSISRPSTVISRQL